MKYEEFGEPVMKIIEQLIANPSGNVAIEDVRGILDTLSEFNKEALEITDEKLRDELSVSYLPVIHSGLLSMTLHGSSDSIRMFQEEWYESLQVNPNTAILHILVQISNISMSVVVLVRKGFDAQAKMLLRSLLELINICIVIMAQKDKMIEYCKGRDENTAKSVWTRSFRTKPVSKLVTKIENSLSFEGVEALIFDLTKNDRRELYKFLSNIAHGSFYTASLGSYSRESAEGTYFLNVFGKYTYASSKTLADLSVLLLYFLVMFDCILREVHNFSFPDNGEPFWGMIKLVKDTFYASAVTVFYEKYVK